MTYKSIKSMLCTAMAALMASCGGEGNGGNTPGTDPEPPASGEQGNKMVVYEANPLFFADSQCFDAINARLDKIRALGSNVLWLMPIYTQGKVNAIGSPYCVADYTGINPQYGDMSSLKRLVDNAHGKGMIVILDWVANHTAWDNPWITEHPDWFAQEDGKIISPPGMGWLDVAELNYDNAAMRAAMIDAMIYWMREAKVDGFRCDYAEGVPHDFWKQAIDSIRNVKADALMLAEASKFDIYDDGFNMIYDWSYCTDLQSFFKGKITFDKLLELTAAKTEKIPAGKHIMRYVVNHDVISEHSPAELYGSNDAIEPAYVLTAFLEQVPLIYSGMEAGFDRRTAFINAKPLIWNAELQSRYEAIGKAYDATAEARGGDLKTYAAGKAVCYSHTNGSKSVLVMVNPTDAEVEVKTPMSFSAMKMTDMMSGRQQSMPASVKLAPYGYSIYAN